MPNNSQKTTETNSYAKITNSGCVQLRVSDLFFNDFKKFVLFLTQDDGPSAVTKRFITCYTPVKM